MIESEAGGTAMTTVLKKIQSAVGEGGIELELFAKAANMSSAEFKKAFETDAVSALDALIKGLAKSAGEGKNLTTILGDLGIKGIREADTMLRMAGASDLLSEAVNTSTTAWKENTALTNEAEQRYKTTESRLKILWNRVKDTAISLGDALAPAIMDALDAAEPFIKSLEKGSKAFSEMDKEQQRTILKLIGLVAAVGPASMALGGLSKGIGSVLSVGSKFAGVLGLAPGGIAASLGTIAGPAALAGIAIGGLAALVVSVKKDIEKAKEVNLEHAESLVKQQGEVETLSERFKELQDKNKLSNDELLRLRDIQDELKFATTAEEVKLLKDEQDKLQEKSGLTNDELDEMLTLNDNLIKLVPEVEKALSDHGNAVITDADALDKANEKLKRNIELELENQRVKAEAQLNTNIKEYLNSLDELNKKEAERNKLVKERDKTEKEIADLRIKAQDQINSGKDKEAEKTIDEIANLKILLSQQNSRLIQLADEVTEKQKSVEKSQEEIEKTQKLYDKMIDLQLATAGINATGAEGIAQLDSAIEKTKKRIEELQKIKKEQGTLNSEQQKELEKLLTKLDLYDNTKTKIQKIQGEQSSVNTKIDDGIKKAGDLNRELGKDAKKNVDIDDDGKVKDLNEEISKSVIKKVTLKTAWEGFKTGLKTVLPFFAEGTKGAPGGPALVGEEGPELARYQNKWALLNHGIVDLPRGTEVFTNAETKKILGAITRMNRIPAYADGISAPGAFDKVLSQLDNSQKPSNIFNFEGMMQGATFVVREEADINKIARELHKLTKASARSKGVII